MIGNAGGAAHFSETFKKSGFLAATITQVYHGSGKRFAIRFVIDLRTRIGKGIDTEIIALIGVQIQ